MKRGHIYTLAFMVACAVVLTFALALAYEAFKPAIQKNRELREQRAVLSALGADEGLSDAQVAEAYEQKITGAQAAKEGEKPVLAYTEGGQVTAYAVPFSGGALWGAIEGYIGVDAAKTRLTGLSFTAQNETPGLGGRIEETAWLEQFRGLPIAAGEQARYGEGEGWRVDAVTGATQTSNAVMRVINQALAERVFAGEVE